MASSSESTEYEAQDSFVDAEDTVARASPVSVPRSLTDNNAPNGEPATPKASIQLERPLSVPSMAEELNTDIPNNEQKDGDDNKYDEVDLSSTQTAEESTPKKSPLPMARRLSASSMDEVNLASSKDEEERQSSTPSPSTDEKKELPPTPPQTAEPPPSRIQGLSSALPSIPWGPPPVNKNAVPPSAPAPAPSPPPRRGPFAWLTRASTSRESRTPPPASNTRRGTANSISTTGSNDGYPKNSSETASVDSKRVSRSSLKDQFKLLRMREEGSPDADDRSSVRSGIEKLHPLAPNSTTIPENEEVNTKPPPSPTPTTASTHVNPNLPPGTVSGISTSQVDATAPVDWELWQQIVNYGPEALNGSNSAELNAAIKRGIPQTIRGVIWQVLADSRNPELEDVYRELLNRGNEKDRTPSYVNGNSSSLPGSSPSSSHSEGWSNADGTSSPNQEKDHEHIAKVQAENDAAKKKRAKDEAVALQKLEKSIRRDLGSRTSYSKYFMSQKNQEGLFGLCKAYALYDEAVGYAQGMNFIAIPLLFNMEDGEAFTLMVKLMNKYGMRDMFIQGMPGLHLRLYQFERLLEDLDPALACHLYRRGVVPQLYATQWFLTLFAYRFPLQLVLRIYDLIFEEGVESTILRFSVAIMLRNSETMRKMQDMASLATFLKEKVFDAYIDHQPSASSILESGFFGSSGSADKEIYRADIMVQDACDIKLTPEMLNTYKSEWEEKTRTEKELAVEIEGYRQTIAAQSARIRTLEEQNEKSDREHVQIASELVRVKVENEELTDSNETLKIQVEELRNVVDRQPGEIEDKLRTEMERIMRRNIEVQEENRELQEQIEETEQHLVETKMKFAEISENHDSLKQKWHDLRKALDD